MLILYWIGGEFGTALVASTLFAFLYGEEIPYLFIYLVAYIGGSIGASLVFKIVAKLPDLNTTEVRASDANA
jgi:glycerol uptake facilitator-like aquaporin